MRSAVKSSDVRATGLKSKLIGKLTFSGGAAPCVFIYACELPVCSRLFLVIPCRYNFIARLSSCEVSLCVFAFLFRGCYLIFASRCAAASGK